MPLIEAAISFIALVTWVADVAISWVVLATRWIDVVVSSIEAAVSATDVAKPTALPVTCSIEATISLIDEANCGVVERARLRIDTGAGLLGGARNLIGDLRDLGGLIAHPPRLQLPRAPCVPREKSHRYSSQAWMITSLAPDP
jgi:hypothetical protein